MITKERAIAAGRMCLFLVAPNAFTEWLHFRGAGISNASRPLHNTIKFCLLAIRREAIDDSHAAPSILRDLDGSRKHAERAPVRLWDQY